MMAYLAEFLGTFLLILIGDSVVANVSLEKSGMKGGDFVHITVAWGFAVLIPACIFGASSGAVFNPALTLALAIDGSLAWSVVPGYIIAQFAGGFLGAVVVYLMFADHFDETTNQGTILGVFCTSPSIPNMPRNFFCEVVATFVLVFAIKGMGNVAGAADIGLSNFIVFGIITSVGMSFGGLTGYAINPARDLAPRLAHTVLPIKNKGDSNWGYAIVPLFGPIVGAVLAFL